MPVFTLLSPDYLLCVCVHVECGTHLVQKGMPDALELVVSCPVWVLETELGSSARAQMLFTTEPTPQPTQRLFISYLRQVFTA